VGERVLSDALFLRSESNYHCLSNCAAGADVNELERYRQFRLKGRHCYDREFSQTQNLPGRYQLAVTFKEGDSGKGLHHHYNSSSWRRLPLPSCDTWQKEAIGRQAMMSVLCAGLVLYATIKCLLYWFIQSAFQVAPPCQLGLSGSVNRNSAPFISALAQPINSIVITNPRTSSGRNYPELFGARSWYSTNHYDTLARNMAIAWNQFVGAKDWRILLCILKDGLENRLWSEFSLVSLGRKAAPVPLEIAMTGFWQMLVYLKPS